jgi:hypothetical protein
LLPISLLVIIEEHYQFIIRSLFRRRREKLLEIIINIMRKKLIVLSGFVLGLAPVMAFAQNAQSCDTVQSGTVQKLICVFGNILDTIIPILVVLGLVYFVWGVITYVISDDEEAKKAGRDRMIFGIIGLVVIVGLWGLVHIVSNTFGINQEGSPPIPTVQF